MTLGHFDSIVGGNLSYAGKIRCVGCWGWYTPNKIGPVETHDHKNQSLCTECAPGVRVYDPTFGKRNYQAR